MSIRTAQDTYRQLNRGNHRAGNIGDNPIVVQSKALNVATTKAKQGGRLILGYAMTKYGVVLTIAIGVGNTIVRSPSLDALAVGMGCVSAAAWLITWSAQRHACIGYNEQELTQIANSGHDGALHGKWGDLE